MVAQIATDSETPNSRFIWNLRQGEHNGKCGKRALRVTGCAPCCGHWFRRERRDHRSSFPLWQAKTTNAPKHGADMCSRSSSRASVEIKSNAQEKLHERAKRSACSEDAEASEVAGGASC